MSRRFENYIKGLSDRGLLTEDPEGIYCGGGKSAKRLKKFYVQLDGNQTTKPYWTEVTEKTISQFIREDLKDYPDAMVLKTEYV